MPNSQIGWAPPERVKRPLMLPEWLDHELQEKARETRSTPSAILADALGNAVEEGWTASQEAVEATDTALSVERMVALDGRVFDTLDQRVEGLRAGDPDADLSRLATQIVAFYLHHRVRQPGGEQAAS